MKSLIVYFSRTGENYFDGAIRNINKGNTEVVAEKIAEFTGGDLFKLEMEYQYAVDYYMCVEQVKQELIKDSRPKFLHPLDSISKYDIIYLGYPNWWGTFPRVVATFIESYDFSGKKIKPFCTHGGSGMESSELELRRTAEGITILPGLSIYGDDIYKSDSKIKEWIEK